uniref:Ribonucleoside-diphosphate reductase n=1 Tax=Heterorhabditis bacteriophora TaxID=37862 RepID=A0A1I7XT72_HETBA
MQKLYDFHHPNTLEHSPMISIETLNIIMANADVMFAFMQDNYNLISVISHAGTFLLFPFQQCALISKSAGGIGLNVHCIRATGSIIAGTNGTSNGLIPMLRVYNNTARYVDQGGNKRPGAFAIYLEPWHADIFEFTKVLTRNLNKIIDINYYPVEEARRSNTRHRPIGLGVQGLADAFMLMRYPFTSPEARDLNKRIFETIYYAALEASCELAEELGELY